MFTTKTNPKVSIIIPTYNRANYIIETIESIQKQTWQNWEVIIIDDGSDDNTEEVIAGIKNKNIQFYKAGRTGVTGKLKNIGIRLAKGELIAFIDSDDLWAPTKLEKQIAALEQYPEAGFCLTGGYNFKKLNEPIDYFFKQKNGIKYGNIFLDCFTSEVHGFTQALLFRKEYIEVSGWFKEEKTFSDIDFIINLARHFNAVILYEPLVYRRLHNANYIHSAWTKSYYEGIAIIKEYKELLPRDIARNALFRLYINFGEKYLRYNNSQKAIGKFYKAWVNQPLSSIPFKKTVKSIVHLFK